MMLALLLDEFHSAAARIINLHVKPQLWVALIINERETNGSAVP